MTNDLSDDGQSLLVRAGVVGVGNSTMNPPLGYHPMPHIVEIFYTLQ